MNIIGLDPGLCHPAVAYMAGQNIDTYSIDTKGLTGMRRIKYILEKLFLPQPNRIIMEGYAFGMGRGLACRLADMGELCGIVKWECEKRNVEVIVITPTALKKFATGKGNSNKEAVRDAANKEREKAGLPWLKTHDEADAYWLLKIGLELEYDTLELPALPKYREDVIEQIKNPAEKPKRKKAA